MKYNAHSSYLAKDLILQELSLQNTHTSKFPWHLQAHLGIQEFVLHKCKSIKPPILEYACTKLCQVQT